MLLSNFRVSAALVTLASMFLAVPASATNYPLSCRLANASCVGGNISVRNDVSTWSLTIKDNKRDGNCAYARIEIDRSRIGDIAKESPRACGQGKSVSYTYTANKSDETFRVVGARVLACVDRNLQPDSCSEAFYEAER